MLLVWGPHCQNNVEQESNALLILRLTDEVGQMCLVFLS